MAWIILWPTQYDLGIVPDPQTLARRAIARWNTVLKNTAQTANNVVSNDAAARTNRCPARVGSPMLAAILSAFVI